jgi:hypothetical protein
LSNVQVVRNSSRVGDKIESRTRNVTIGMSDQRYRMLSQIIRAYRMHSWTNATVNVIGRSLIGSGWEIVPSEEDDVSPSKSGKKKIERFLSSDECDYTNIKDFVGLAGKIAQTGMMFKLTGQFAWEIIRRNGKPVGFDVVSGYVRPNVDSEGNLLSPPFYAFPWDHKGPDDIVEYDLNEIVYSYNPGVTGDISGETVYEALSVTAIPSDLSAGTSYRELFYNVNAPYNGVWEVDESVSDDDFDKFCDLLEDRYSGPENFGRNPLVIRGRVEFKPISSRSKEDAPYLEGRRYTQEEISAVTGVDGNKMGITESSNKANMRETRREYHENVMRPLTRWLEDEIYRQVFVRILGVRGWKLVFKRPDFMNALEQATIDSRDIQSGIVNPNEVRSVRGMKPRKNGDEFRTMPGSGSDTAGGEGMPTPADQGGPGLGSGNPGRPRKNAPERPPRDEEDTSKYLSNVALELKAWKKYHLRMMDGKVDEREFDCKYTKEDLRETVMEMLEDCGSDFNLVRNVFEAASAAAASIIQSGVENE